MRIPPTRVFYFIASRSVFSRLSSSCLQIFLRPAPSLLGYPRRYDAVLVGPRIVPLWCDYVRVLCQNPLSSEIQNVFFRAVLFFFLNRRCLCFFFRFFFGRQVFYDYETQQYQSKIAAFFWGSLTKGRRTQGILKGHVTLRHQILDVPLSEDLSVRHILCSIHHIWPKNVFRSWYKHSNSCSAKWSANRRATPVCPRREVKMIDLETEIFFWIEPEMETFALGDAPRALGPQNSSPKQTLRRKLPCFVQK